MKSIVDNIRVVPLICSVQYARNIREIVALWKPDTIYHAAAYKHVPIQERFPWEAVKTNVFGSLNLVKSSISNEVEKFVLVSTDKAVNPVNVMGATKRLAEIIMQNFNQNHSKTAFMAVRFGNVLGSSGSVIPIFKEQIKKGGPVTVTDPGINYTEGTLSINTIPGIISQGGAGAEVTVFIPPTGNGATIFPIGNEIGKIKTIKNSNFGFDYPHDYTLRPEITFPVNLQLRDASALNDIKITNPGSGYTTIPEVIISGGGGSGATAVATVRNNRLDGIEVTNPGQGYSSPPTVSIASVFAYQVNLDDQLMQFSFPHGINTGDIVRLQGEALEGVAHVLPSPSSAGLVSLDSATNYFAVAGTANNLDDDQLRIALTLQDAQTGAFITFANTGQGKQQLTTEAFAGAAEAIVDVVTFLPGEYVYLGDDPDNTNAAGYVSEIDGWQKGPRILRLTRLISCLK